MEFNEPFTWKNIASTCKEVAESTIGLQQQGRKPWISSETWECIEKRRELKAKMLTTKNSREKILLRTAYNSVEKEVKRRAKKDKYEYYNNIATHAERAAYHNDLRGVYQSINKLVNVKPHIPPLKDDNGNIIVSEEDQLNQWQKFFEDSTVPPTRESYNLNNTTRHTVDTNISTDPPSIVEIEFAIKRLKNHKSAGSDNIAAELIKNAPDILAPVLYPIFQQVWIDNVIPSEWKEGVIITIPKKGDLSDCRNWRGITLLNTIIKLLAFIILDRISPTINATIRQEQNGFRPQRSCVDHINTLRIIIEQSVEWRSPLYLLFVDFERAFDTINRDAIWSSLREKGIPEKLIEVIWKLYDNAKCIVRFKGKDSNKFAIHKGVRQGCILSPLLFIVVLDSILTQTDADFPDGIQWRPYQKIGDLDYADDICFMSHTYKGIKCKLESLIENARKVGLRVNFKKTKLMRIETPNQTPLNITIDAKDFHVEDVEEFTYLGSIISKDGGADKDVSMRVNKARYAYHKLKKVWSAPNISQQTKLRIFNASVKPVLLYGSETWKVTDAICNKLQVFINRCLRRICRIFWPSTISNVDLYLLTNNEPIPVEIKRRKWRWIGHTLRKADNDIAKMAFEWNPQGSRRRGRPRSTWLRSVNAECSSMGSWSQIKQMAQDRQQWTTFVSALCSA